MYEYPAAIIYLVNTYNMLGGERLTTCFLTPQILKKLYYTYDIYVCIYTAVYHMASNFCSINFSNEGKIS